jgi:hypothetical protein
MKRRSKYKKVLLDSILLYVKAERKNILEDVAKRELSIQNQIMALYEWIANLSNKEKLIESELQDRKPFEFSREEFLGTVDKYIDTKNSAMLENLLEEVKSESDKVLKKKDKVDTTVQTLIDEIARMKSMMQRLQFSSGGGGFAGGNIDQYMGMKYLKVDPVADSIIFDCVYGNTFDVTLTENINSVILKNWPSDTVSQRVVVYLRQDATGGKTLVGWPTNILWPYGQLPILSTDPNAIDCLVFETFDGGQTVFGNIAGQNYKQV